MTQQISKLAVLFVDVCGSTALYDNLGDDKARQLIAECLGLLVKVIDQYRGVVVKTIGDEVMCSFVNAETAFQAACSMQQAMKDSRSHGRYPMHVRIGFHYGDVIIESGDIFGDTVNIAARISNMARASQIMTTQAVVNSLSPASRDKTRQVMRTDLKGKQEQFDIYLVIWEEDDMMSTRIGIPTFHRKEEKTEELVLHYRGQILKVNKQKRSVILGRGDACDLVVENNYASRQHVRLEYRSGKYFLVDQSTNGTYVRMANGHVTYFIREEGVLEGSGTISLGHAYTENPSELVHFEVTASEKQDEMQMKTTIFSAPPIKS